MRARSRASLVVRRWPRARNGGVRLVAVDEGQESPVAIEDFVSEGQEIAELLRRLSQGDLIALNQLAQRIAGRDRVAMMIGRRARSEPRLEMGEQRRLQELHG